jgi:hypothetical protein
MPKIPKIPTEYRMKMIDSLISSNKILSKNIPINIPINVVTTTTTTNSANSTAKAIETKTKSKKKENICKHCSKEFTIATLRKYGMMCGRCYNQRNS